MKMKILSLSGIILALASLTSSMTGAVTPTVAVDDAKLTAQVTDDQVELRWPVIEQVPDRFECPKSPEITRVEKKILEERKNWELLGYLIFISNSDPGAHSSRALSSGVKLRLYWTQKRRLLVPNLEADKNYFANVEYILANIHGHNRIMNFDPRWGGNGWAPALHIQTSEVYKARKFSGEELLPDSHVRLQELYEHPDSYIGKIIEVEGYFNIFDSPFKKNSVESPVLGDVVTRSDESITDGKIKLIVQGRLRAGIMESNYVKLIGYFSNGSKSTIKITYPPQQKPGYRFHSLAIEEYLKK